MNLRVTSLRPRVELDSISSKPSIWAATSSMGEVKKICTTSGVVLPQLVLTTNMGNSVSG